MFMRSHISPRHSPFGWMFGLTLLTCLLWLSCNLFRQPAPAVSPQLAADNQPQAADALPGAEHPLQGKAAKEFLEQTAGGRSLMEAVRIARYGLKRQQDNAGSGYWSVSEEQNLKALFGKDGVSLQPAVMKTEQAWRMDMQLKAYGYGEQLASAGAITSQRVKGNRIEYERADSLRQTLGSSLGITDFGSPATAFGLTASARPTVVEWYENQANGIEQGFNLNERPARGAGVALNEPLRLVISLSGDLRARLKDEGREIDLLDESGRRALSYSNLVAKDASGRELVARMETGAEGSEIVLVVDDQNAQYPIVVDPLAWEQVAELKGGTGAYNKDGYSVGISGDTAIVGCYHDQFYNEAGFITEGQVYIFVRGKDSSDNSPTWDYQATLWPDKDSGQFGAAVAISGDTAIVGDIYGTLDLKSTNFGDGTVYVFVRNGTTWEKTLRIEGTKGGAEFGKSVAIDGNTIVIGAPGEGDFVNTLDQGAAYIFAGGGASWTQQAHLLASDGRSGDRFGWSVGISGDRVIIGAPFHSEGTDSKYSHGQAYISSRNGGAWSAPEKLSGAEGGYSGYSVGVSGNAAIVGDPANSRVYISRRNPSGAWSTQILNTPTSARGFGSSVAIYGSTAIVGAPFSDVATATGINNRQGAAFVFSSQTVTGVTGPVWKLTDTLTPEGGTAGDHFGFSVAIGSHGLIVGAPARQVEAKRYQGEAYIFEQKDSDGDGLPDDWEKRGVTIEGTFIDLPKMGANPLHKDVFVHADWMRGQKPTARAIKMVVDAFARAPAALVKNPDDKDGINLHVDLGRDSIDYVTRKPWKDKSQAGEVPYTQILGSEDANGFYQFDAFDELSKLHFDPSFRQAIFHHALFADKLGTDAGGISRGTGTADFIIAHGLSYPHGPLDVAATFMHELGHSLGLEHGGDKDINRKPNYLSVMNYWFSHTGLLPTNRKQPKLDYSRLPLPALDETNLNELVGIQDQQDHLTLWSLRTAPDLPIGTNKCIDNLNSYHKIFLPTRALDWNCDGLKTNTPVIADINSDGACVATGNDHFLNTPVCNGVSLQNCDDEIRFGRIVSGPNRQCETTASELDVQLKKPGFIEPDVLNGYEDWSHLSYAGGGRIGNTAAFSMPKEMSVESGEEPIQLALQDIPPELLDEQQNAPLDEVTLSPEEGFAPLKVDFDGSASTAASGATIVSWEWDFGDGTTGSGAQVTHTYITPGEYNATLIVTDSAGRENLVPLLRTVIVTANNLPNLTPTQPQGWSDKIVISKVTGTNVDNAPLTSADFIYLDWAAINNGGLAAETPFLAKLYVDGVERASWTTTAAVGAGGNITVQDYPIGSLTAGQHALRVVLDTDGVITEKNEADNEYTKVVEIFPDPQATPSPTPTLGLKVGDLDPGFNPVLAGFRGESVYAVVTQPDGKTIVGGDFESFAGCARRNIARLTADGKCDTSFDPGLALTYVFQSIENTTNRANLYVKALALQPDGKILAGISYTALLPGALKNNQMIFRFNPDGTLDSTFDATKVNLNTSCDVPGQPCTPPTVTAIALQADGRIIIGGAFIYKINGERVSGIARLNADGSLDTSFIPPTCNSDTCGAGQLNTPRGISGINVLAMQTDGKVLLGVGSYPGGGPPTVQRLNSDGSRDTGFNVSTTFPSYTSGFRLNTSEAQALALQPDGKILVGGILHDTATGTNSGFARLNQDGSRDRSFDTPHGPHSGAGIALQPDGKVVVVGDFSITTPAVRNRIARLNQDGSLDTSFNAVGVVSGFAGVGDYGGYVNAVAMKPEGQIVAAGNFINYNGAWAEGIMLINPDGNRDPLFDSNGPGHNSVVNALARQPDGKLLLGLYCISCDYQKGEDTSKVNNVRYGGIARINQNGTPDTSFASPFTASSITDYIALQADGKILISGNFRLRGTDKDIKFTRLNSNGSLDTSFVPAGGDFYTYSGRPVVQPDGKIIVFRTYFGSGDLVRLNSDGSPDDTFTAASTLGGHRLPVLQPDGRLLTVVSRGGNSISVERLNVDGSVDNSFNAGSGSDTGPVRDIILQPDGKVLVCGDFLNFNGAPRNQIVRLNANGSVDTSFVPVDPNHRTVSTLAVQEDGKIVVGNAQRYWGSPLENSRVFRVNRDGSLDSSFPLGTGLEKGEAVNAILIQPDKSIIVGGDFNVANGAAHLGLAKFIGALTSAATPTPTPPVMPTPIPIATPTVSPTPIPTPSPVPTPTPAMVQLGSDFYTISEKDPAGVVLIPINRTGDTTVTISVNYSTSDDAGLIPCQNSANGNASDRCDYGTQIGTLRFAAGETSKTITIPIINDGYAESDEVFKLTLSSPQSSQLDVNRTATIIILDDDLQPAKINPIDDQANFIRQQYIDFLGREPEPAGFAFWLNRMNNCPQGQVCDRIDTSKRFFESDEFQERGFYVYRLYDAVLGRLPRYAEFISDVARLNGPQTVSEQRQGKDAFLLDFMNRSEFKALYGQYLSANLMQATDAAGFVNALCAKAGLTPASKQALITNLQTGARDPAHTMEDFILSPELSAPETKFYDRARIVMQYFGYLRRDPEAGGFEFWQNQLIGPNAPHRGDYRFMVGGFINSDEYRFRFALISAQ